MERKHFDFSAFAVAIIIIAILFSACSIGNRDLTNENTSEPSNIVDENTTGSENVASEIYTNPHDIPGSFFDIWDCFIASDPEEDPVSVEIFDSYDCTPGYVYFAKELYGEIKPLFEKKCKPEFLAELIDKIYVITEDNEVVKITKEDEKNETIYKSQYGTIDSMHFDRAISRYMYFSDGDYIIRLDPKNDQCTVVTHSDNGIRDIRGSGGSYDKVGAFYCEKCNEEYVVWEDTDGNTYWYHPETDINEKINYDDLYIGHPGVF